MKLDSMKIRAVPTNIITGFLGVGKTSAILHLLKNKPVDERWAVLVNEFGEIGVDGSLFESQYPQSKGVFVREVPGGCMCCAAGLPMQVALNHLLSQAKPNRLLIEPTGLGHPKEVLQVLSTEHYQETLSLKKILTLVDARKLNDERYIRHETFNQQIAIADVVIGNKLDLYDEKDKANLASYVKELGQSYAEVLCSNHGQIPLSVLNGSTSIRLSEAKHFSDNIQYETQLSSSDIPVSGFIQAVNEGEGFRSIGWRFSPEKIFNHGKLLTFMNDLQAERMKAVCITDKGVFCYNLTQDTLTELEIDDCVESRIEIISENLDSGLNACLMDCLN